MPLHGYPIIIPAIVAEIRDAIDPPIKAFIPNLDKVLRWMVGYILTLTI